jgi:hypothetical protein
MRTLSDVDLLEGRGHQEGTVSGGLFGVETELGGSPSSPTVEDGSHRCDEQDRACWVGQHRDNDEWGEGIRKGLGSGGVARREGGGGERHWGGLARAAMDRIGPNR